MFNPLRRWLFLFVRLKKHDFLKIIAIRLLFTIVVIFCLITLINLYIWSKNYRPDNNFDHLTTQIDLIEYSNNSQFNEVFFRDNLSINKFYRLQWSTQASDARPWFMSNGTIRPSSKYSKYLALWPEDIRDSDYSLPQSDRIVNQLMFVPEVEPKSLKTILLFFGTSGMSWIKLGQKQFLSDKCPVSSCSITDDATRIDSADAVFFKDRFMWPINGRRNSDQIWILYFLENPYHTMRFIDVDLHIFNWTATYRHDSDIVAPYGKFVHYNTIYDKFETPSPVLTKNDSNKKNTFYDKNPNGAQIAWFVSNCGARNGRLYYARELSRHIEVDIYGSCSTKKCPRYNSSCLSMLKGRYRYYLSFENANCRDYVTEKFFSNALDKDLIPIVMGATRDDYERIAPYNSFIHVDDFESPKHLATFLHQLNRDPVAFDRYKQWRYSKHFGGEMINTYFWCRLCAMLHAPPKPKRSYENIENWWNGEKICLRSPLKKWNKSADST